MRTYSRKIGKDNMLTILGSLFFFIGLIFVVAGFFVWRADKKFFKTAQPTSAEIVDIVSYRDSDGDVRHEVYVSYVVDDRVYEYVRLNTYTSSMYIGKEVEIFYSPADPGIAKMKSGSTVLIFVFIGMGGVFAVIGGCVLAGRLKVRKKSKLRETGCCMRLPIIQITTNNVTVNGVPGHVVICGNQDMSGGGTGTYESDPCYDWISDYMKPGDLIAVYYDPADPSRYFVDLSDVQHV